MNSVVTVIIAVLLAAGLFFSLTGVVGILRMPDVFGRLQTSTCISTLGTLCTAAAGILYAASSGMTAGTAVKLAVLALLILCTNPVSNHALCKAAYRMGIRPAEALLMDDYGKDFGEKPPAEDKADLPDEQFDHAFRPIEGTGAEEDG